MVRYALLALALCGIGCGGTVVGGGSGDGGDGGGSSDGAKSDSPVGSEGGPEGGKDSGSPWSPVCPEEQPALGSACSLPSGMDVFPTLCEYGKLQYDVSCDTVLLCRSGSWAAETFESSCQPDAPNSAACPATYAALMDEDGGSCSDNGLRCEYPEGVCSCSTGFGGPIMPDGGTSWFCNPGPSCPMPRPRLGSSCSGSSQNCTYLTCEFSETCQKGYWQGELEACASPGGGGGEP
jgi:hypothetical protein